jgi:chromosome segregation and condensation protein ScpB
MLLVKFARKYKKNTIKQMKYYSNKIFGQTTKFPLTSNVLKVLD